MSYQPVPMAPRPIDKSVGIAFLLTFLFGPFGVLYVEVPAAIVLLVLSVILGLLTAGLLLPVFWLISIILGCVRASQKHSEFQTWVAHGYGHQPQMPYHPGYSQGPTPAVPPLGAQAPALGPATPQPWPQAAPPGPMPAAGWYPDPADPRGHRWWDGQRWSEHRSGPS